jgi:hypothetical protein
MLPAMGDTSWRVLPHQPIEKLEENLWRVEGDLEGMPLKRVMTVAKRSDGGLVIHNGIALEEDAMRELERFGEPTFLVVPNGYHRMDAGRFKARYPKLKVVCPRGAKKKVEQVVHVDLDYETYPQDDAVGLRTLEGFGEAEGVMTVRSSGRTSIVLNDALFNMPHLTGAHGFVLRHVTGSSGGPKVSRIARWFIIKDSRAFRAELERLADTPDLVRVIVSHHETISEDVPGTLRRVAATL